MVALGLVTTEHLEGEWSLPVLLALLQTGSDVMTVTVCLLAEIQTKRQERKRRSTANPAYSGMFEPEVRKTNKQQTMKVQV